LNIPKPPSSPKSHKSPKGKETKKRESLGVRNDIFEIASVSSKNTPGSKGRNAVMYSPEFGKIADAPEGRESSETKKTAP